MKLVKLFPTPRGYSRRTESFTANVCGMTTRLWKLLRGRCQWRVNDGPWVDVRFEGPRAHSRHFRLEVPDSVLRAGLNQVWVRARALALEEVATVSFEYDPTPVAPPLVVDWSQTGGEVEDGWWETVLTPQGWRVRPRPGEEGYDRILVAAGAFEGGRRVETDVVFRSSVAGRPFAFGLLPLWGGRPDPRGRSPRLGWSFSLTWLWSRYQGYGSEFSHKVGDGAPLWCNAYRSFAVAPGTRCFIVAEAWPERSADGRHRRWRQRVKWWAEGQDEPDTWLESCDDGASLPAGEYGVGLIAYWTQVDYGPVVIRPIRESSCANATSTSDAMRSL